MIFVLVQLIFGVACNSIKESYQYTDSTETYQISEKVIPDGQLVSFFDTTSNHFLRAVGQYKNDVRVGIWSFYTKERTTVTNWGRYNNPALGVLTSLFGQADTTINGEYYVKFKFRTESGIIIATLAVDGPDAKYEHRLFFEGIEEIMVEEQSTIMKVDKLRLIDGANTLYISKHHLKASDGTGRLIQNCRSRINDGEVTILINIVSDDNATSESALLFDGVLTNFFFKGHKLFNPVGGQKLNGFGW